jgi:hypothetical protein
VTYHQNLVCVDPGANFDQATTIFDTAYDRAIFGNVKSILRPWLLFAAVVAGLYCVGKTTWVQAADGRTALPLFAPWVGDLDGMQQRRQIGVQVPVRTR